MSEKLSDEEIKQLEDALEDGFRDDYLPGSKLTKVDLGNLFDTNPLKRETVYYRTVDPFDETRIRTATSRENRDEEGLFDDVSWETDMFWNHSFGFNFEKVEAYFRARRDEVVAEFMERYKLEVDEDFTSGLIDDEPDTFEQWLENRIFPYTKRWYERHIFDTLSRIRWHENYIRESSKPLSEMSLSEFHFSRLIERTIILGRMVEDYRWKFQYESKIVQRAEQFQKAGSGGGQNSRNRRTKRLEAFMNAIEELRDLFPRIGEDAIVKQAFENAAEKYSNFWKQGPGQSERYATDLRSEEPFKQRYFAVFKKST